MDLSAIGFVDTTTPQHIILMRILVAAILGGVIGFERERSNNGAAGLRTHILIATAACLFTQLAFEIYARALEDGSTNTDPIRAVEATTAGIAFLGAGAIFQQRGSVRGLTTGAGMWLAGAIGVCAALGYYIIAFAVSVFAVIVLAALRAFAHQVIGDDEDEDESAASPKPARKTGKSFRT